MKLVNRGLVVATAMMLSTSAFAQDEVDESVVNQTENVGGSTEPPPPETQPAPQPMEQQPMAHAGGPRFRFGFSGGGGLLLSDLPTFTYGGIDIRTGLQINDLFAVYLQPQLGFYGGGVGAFTGFGGLVGASVLGEVTLIDRIFAGAGVGYGILNSPSGFEVHLRAGGYPLMSKREDGRRKGLMLGVDFRVHFLDGATFIAPTFCLGYESF
jgi:hypothetical protein